MEPDHTDRPILCSISLNSSTFPQTSISIPIEQNGLNHDDNGTEINPKQLQDEAKRKSSAGKKRRSSTFKIPKKTGKFITFADTISTKKNVKPRATSVTKTQCMPKSILKSTKGQVEAKSKENVGSIGSTSVCHLTSVATSSPNTTGVMSTNGKKNRPQRVLIHTVTPCAKHVSRLNTSFQPSMNSSNRGLRTPQRVLRTPHHINKLVDIPEIQVVPSLNNATPDLVKLNPPSTVKKNLASAQRVPVSTLERNNFQSQFVSPVTVNGFVASLNFDTPLNPSSTVKRTLLSAKRVPVIAVTSLKKLPPPRRVLTTPLHRTKSSITSFDKNLMGRLNFNSPLPELNLQHRITAKSDVLLLKNGNGWSDEEKNGANAETSLILEDRPAGEVIEKSASVVNGKSDETVGNERFSHNTPDATSEINSLIAESIYSNGRVENPGDSKSKCSKIRSKLPVAFKHNQKSIILNGEGRKNFQSQFVYGSEDINVQGSSQTRDANIFQKMINEFGMALTKRDDDFTLSVKEVEPLKTRDGLGADSEQHKVLVERTVTLEYRTRIFPKPST